MNLGARLRTRPEHRAFLVALVCLAALRALWLLAFPFAFGHPDSVKYLAPAVGLLEGRGFLPHPVSVSGTYAPFVAVILKVFASSAWIVFFQHVLGIGTAALAAHLTWLMGRSKGAALAVLLLVGGLPRAIFYEHILLVEALYTFLGIAWTVFAVHYLRRPTDSKALALGVLSAACLLSRGQGLLFPLLGAAWLVFGAFSGKIPWHRFAQHACLALIPALLAGLWYRTNNLRVNQLPALSYSGSFNLFWVASGNLTDFSSPRHSDLKAMVEPAVRYCNGKYQGRPAWAFFDAPWEEAIQKFDTHFAGNFGAMNTALVSLGTEAVLTHPVAFSYRAVWNSIDALKRRGVCQTRDLSELLLDCGKGWIRLSPDLARDSRHWNKLGSWDRDLSAIPADRPLLRGLADSILNLTQPLADQRLLTLGLALFLFGSLALGAGWTYETALLLLLYVAQFALTFPLVNAEWDRYFVPLEPYNVVLGILGWLAVRRAVPAARKKAFGRALAVVVAGLAGFLIASRLPALTLGLDRSILGMAPEQVEKMHVRVLAWIAFLVCGGLAALRLSKGKRFPQTAGAQR